MFVAAAPVLPRGHVPRAQAIKSERAQVHSRTTTHPGGFTEVSQQYLDGQRKSVAGDSVVAQYYSYAVQGDGTLVTEVRTARPDSPAFERTYTDMLGRTVRVERPGFGGTLKVATSSYDDVGRLTRTTSTGSAATLYEYDTLGEQRRRGLDVDGNGALGESSMDRITENETKFAAVDGAYWQETSQRIYTEDNSPTTKTTGVTRSRLSGRTGGLLSEQVSIDLNGNETRSTARLAGGGGETRTINTPDSTQDAITISVDGRITSSTSTTGLTTTYAYDGLGRRTSAIDPRTGASETHYDAQGRVDYVKDAAGNATSFGYDATTGRKVRETNALGKHSYFAYDARGQLTRSWGDVPYPVEYAYDQYNRRTAMTTFRVEANWSSPTWPEGTGGDTTQWHFEEPTGLLESKEDAAGKAVRYTYGPAGQLATRTWARQKPGGGPLRTSYAYDPATAQLLAVDYNDSTADITYSYDRLGRQKAVTDAAGTRVFAYDPQTLQLQTETMEGLTPAVLRHQYDAVDVKGRRTGLSLDEDYIVGYDFDQVGRTQAVVWTASGTSDKASYTRIPESGLLAGYTTHSGFSTSYAYEPKRDLKTRVKNAWGSTVVSQFDYAYGAVARRTSVKNSGSAFEASAFTKWGYDERNQLTQSDRYLGTNLGDLSQPANAEQRAFAYDPIGNRQTSTAAAVQTSYTANDLNQYESVGQQASVYDEDGNLVDGGTKVLAYNAENQLVRVEVPGFSVSTYDYDCVGRRVRKSVNLVSGDDYVVTWVYSGWAKIEERRVENGTTAVKNFVWGLDRSQRTGGVGGVGGLIAVVDQGGASLFSFDGSGNVSELLDASRGRADAHYEYDAFGNEVLATGPLAAENDWRFSTKQIDPESGLYDYGRRFYQPETGRWTNRDPAEEQGGIGLYVFAFNDAIDWFDPDGRDPRREWELWQRLRDALADDALADEQNWSDSNSDWRWHFTRHSTAFTFCGSDSEREVVLDQMYADLKSFAHFQPNHSDLDLSEGSAGLPGRKAVFDTRGTTSGFDFVPDPSFNEIEVQMTWDGSRRMVRAMTLNGHPLVGVRRWSVQKDGQSGIEFFTDAWEKPRNLLNGIAVAAVGGTLQDSMWQNYLTNFGRAWDGREGVRWNSILHIAEPRYLDGRRENPFRAELPGELR